MTFMIGLFAALVFPLAPLQQSKPSAQEELKSLVDRVARGDEVESADAAERLIHLSVEPLASALGSLDRRPLPEQLRIAQVLGRVHANLRLRLFRADLGDEDRAKLDTLWKRSAPLVEQFFDEDPEVRTEAIAAAPMEKGSATGLLLAHAAADWNPATRDAALEAIRKLKDPGAARLMTKSLADMLAAIRGNLFGPSQDDVIIVLADMSKHVIDTLGDCDYADAAPVIADVLGHFIHTDKRPYFEPAISVRALGKLGDERPVPLLLELLDDPEIARITGAPREGRPFAQSVGDASLLALCRIYRVPPDAFGLTWLIESPDLAGFAEDAQRRAGRQAFRQWQAANGGKPRGERAAPVPVGGGGARGPSSAPATQANPRGAGE